MKRSFGVAASKLEILSVITLQICKASKGAGKQFLARWPADASQELASKRELSCRPIIVQIRNLANLLPMALRSTDGLSVSGDRFQGSGRNTMRFARMNAMNRVTIFCWQLWLTEGTRTTEEVITDCCTQVGRDSPPQKERPQK